MSDSSENEGSIHSEVEEQEPKEGEQFPVNNEMSDSSENEGSIHSEVEKQKPKRRELFPVNNVTALNAKLKSIQLNFDWIETLAISADVEENEVSNDATNVGSGDDKAENDFKREMSFYNQALCAVTKAFKRLHQLGVTTKRPSDYFAEMAKSDSHMTKVREKLLSKQTATERREQIRAIRDQKKQGKKIQQEIVQERKSEKKKMLNALKKTKKGKMSADVLLGTKKDGPSKSDKSKRFREMRDMKYGYGGKKKGSKWNTAESSAFTGKRSGAQRFSKNKNFGKSKPRPKKHRRRR